MGVYEMKIQWCRPGISPHDVRPAIPKCGGGWWQRGYLAMRSVETFHIVGMASQPVRLPERFYHLKIKVHQGPE